MVDHLRFAGGMKDVIWAVTVLITTDQGGLDSAFIGWGTEGKAVAAKTL